MKKKIIVAGAGHGGLSAAAALAKNGYDVTVIEKQKREAMGYDWHDSMRPLSLEIAQIPPIDEKEYEPMTDMCYYNPSLTVKLVADKQSNEVCFVDRKVLINHLLNHAESCGVKLIFETEITKAIYNGSGVKGIEIVRDSKAQALLCDLVIDAAGMFSPVRRSLPACFGIQNEIDEKDIFCVWRGYFEKTDDEVNDPPYSIYFYHCKNPGMDWAITSKDSIDILVGGFGSLSDQTVETAINDFKSLYPNMGDKIVRGGIVDKIPLGKMLPVIICNGYAAVGNSALMTEPLSGSGIDISIRAGKLLADTVIEADGDCSAEQLWKYNFKFFKEYNQKYFSDLTIKNFLSSLDSDGIDFFMEKRIMTEKEIAGSSDGYTLKDLVDKANVVKRPALLLGLAIVLKKLALAEKIKASIPEKYDSSKIKGWTDIYKYL